MGMTFTDRTDAGTQLARALKAQSIDGDVVCAIPRGGLPLGRQVADSLERPLDVVVATKIGAPHNPEYAIGAVASDGSLWLNDEAIESLGVDDAYIDSKTEELAGAAREKARRYRGTEVPRSFTGKSVVLVDDGIATGATVRACLKRLVNDDVSRVTLAVPVGSPRSIAAIEADFEAVVCLETPDSFRAVGQFYDQFEQVSDERAMSYLD